MKKTLLLIAGFAAFNATAQIQIHAIDGSGPDLSGTTLNITIDPEVVNPSGSYFWTEGYLVTNNTGSDGDWFITRKKITVPSGWIDKVCWPPNCYNAGSGMTFETPHDSENPAPTVLNGTTTANQLGTNYSAVIEPQITPDFTTSGSATYKYYITEVGSGTFLDSLTISFNYPLSVKTLTTTSLSIAPNPANENVAITLEGTENAQIRIVDVLGNVVYSKDIMNSTKINTSDFNNGVYFVSIIGENKKAVTKKLIVKH